MNRNSGFQGYEVPRVMDLRGTYKGGGGPDKTILNSAAQHDRKKVHVLVTYLRRPDDAEFRIPDMAAVLGINFVDLPDRKGIDIECLRQLHGLLRKHRLSILHAHDDKTLLYGWLLKLVNPGLRIMYTCHSHAVRMRKEFDNQKEYLGFRLRQRLQIFLMRRYQHPVITVSRDTKNRLVANGMADSSVIVIHNGIDLRKWMGQGEPVLKRELDIPEGGYLVGTVARITKEKDLTTFYRVARLVREKYPNAMFVIVGDGYGDELEKARREVNVLALDGFIRFTGHRTDLIDVYSSFDLFLMTSKSEGLPNTLLEAMALMVPSVATAVGGVPELVEHGRSGFLAEAGDAEGLAEIVIRLLQNPDIRREIGKEGRKRIETRFSFETRVKRIEEYYAWIAGAPDREILPQSDGKACES